MNIATKAQKNIKAIVGNTRLCEFSPKKLITPFSIIFCKKNIMLPKIIEAKIGPSIK